MANNHSGEPDSQPSVNESVEDWLIRIIVKLHDQVEFGSTTKVADFLTSAVSPSLAPAFSIRSLLTSGNRERIRTLMKKAEENDPTYKPRNLLNYFVLTMTPTPTLDIEHLIEFLLSLPPVETAYVALRGEDPQVDPDNDPEFSGQGYLGAAPDGVGAELVWPRLDGSGVRGADGVGLRLIDMELGWTLDHQDLGTHGTVPLYGEIVDLSRQHGTSVLGVISAQDNTVGCVGVVPNIDSVQVVSYAADGLTDFANAMTAAIEVLQPGDVFLLEAQLRGPTPLPIEAGSAQFDLISLATALGIVVIEPSGNNIGGGINLDEYADSTGKLVLRRDSPDFRDSGAIMVAAASAVSPHTRQPNSNFGSRVDCYAWGESVVTSNSNSSGSTDTYRNDFDATSAASAIIAGVAVSVQGMAEQNLGTRLGPGEMRAVLSDRTIGTLSAGDIAAGGTAIDLIGVMPDLNAISRDVLNVSDSLYIRQSPADDGSFPRDPIFMSPDIMLSPSEVDDPQIQFGEGSGTENSDIWRENHNLDEDSFLYVRVRNRGGAPSATSSVAVFWSPLSTLLTPRYWQRVGRAILPRVPAGDLLTVSSAIRWPTRDIQTAGRYGVIAVLGTPSDPEPEPPRFRTWQDYLSFIDERRVAVRNVGVAADGAAFSADHPDDLGYIELSFVAPGPPDRGLRMRLEAEARLPSGSRAWLEAPPLLNQMIQRRAGSTEWVRVNPSGRTVIPGSLFPARSRPRLRLLIHVPRDGGKPYYKATVSQFQENRRVGGITWLIKTERNESLAQIVTDERVLAR